MKLRNYAGVACLLALLLGGCQRNEEVTPDDKQDEVTVVVQEELSVSFLAVGDNLIHGAIFGDPYHVNENGMDFRSVYDPIKPYLKGIDVKNINQETVLGGTELGLSHYPQFNGPQEIGMSVVDAGFNWISQASNHAMDWGETAIHNQLSLWDKYDGVIATGMNRSAQEAQTQRIITVNGLRIGLLNYTYGLNGLSMPEGKSYLINLIDEARIKADIAALKPNCDVMIASMHWGVEYAYTANEEQRALAQMLADEGVHVIIGSHPHVLQNAEFITAKDGRQVLVYYSLGNFLSAQDRGDTMLGGMARFDVVQDSISKEIRIELAQLYPTVTHYNQAIADFKVYLLKDYTDELAAKHYLSAEISRSFFIDLAKQIMGENSGIELVY
ncbi:MAG: CapA family protein [Erysipelotrichaceae bacterium]|nr:CapA family protein [Erysipelotrichaceae bacterium]MCI9313135.1 CapA family protein [Erysipelotrichaceae bacterium]